MEHFSRRRRQQPPKLFFRFFRWYCRPKLTDHIEGDLIEEYNERLKTSGKRKADRKFMIDVLLLCRPGIIRPIKRYRNVNTLSMYKSFIAHRDVGLAGNGSLSGYSPLLQCLTGKSLRPLEIFQLENLATIGVILLTVVLVSGLYPAFFVAGLKPRSFLRENRLPNSMPNLIRSGLLIFQFVVSASLIAAAIFVRQQMDLMKNKDLGFDKEQVISVKLYGDLRNSAIADSDGFKTEFLRNPDIVAVGRTDRMFGERLSVELVVPKGRDPESDQIPDVRVLRVDEGYLDVMKIPLADGRNFSSAVSDASAFIINERAARALGLDNPVDEILENQGNPRTGKIVGVVKDYHFATLHAAIEPLVIEFKPQWTDDLVFRIRAGKTRDALAYIRETVDRLAPNSLFVYTFLDDRIDALYRSEDTMGKVFQFFSVLAIIIACTDYWSVILYD